MYNREKFKYFYYDCYKTRCEKIYKRMNLFLACASCAGIAAWGIWDQYPAVWAMLLAFSQIVSVMRDNLPFVSESIQLRFFIPELQNILIEIEREWNKLDGKSDTEIASLIFYYENKISQIENNYISGLTLAKNKKCAKEATEEQKAFFSFYELEQEEE